ncbi:MAG: class I SAM-dependent methyltransferase [Deltaproteobacteria bacterium]|nr:class I SAM-dependent methyltransferase [Deltaproteobacteria bacterium]
MLETTHGWILTSCGAGYPYPVTRRGKRRWSTLVSDKDYDTHVDITLCDIMPEGNCMVKRSYLDDSTFMLQDSDRDLLEKNVAKWATVPIGKSRIHTHPILNLNDEQLARFYQECIQIAQIDRQWIYENFSGLIENRTVLEIGSGLGCDGVYFSSLANKWTFSDIVYENIQLLKRVCSLLNVVNVDFQVINSILTHDFKKTYDLLYAIGVFHHLPFELAAREIRNIDRFLVNGSYVIVLMYPIERWIDEGEPDFSEFGRRTDGKETPWAEYYTETKVRDLFGPGYRLLKSRRWGQYEHEFITFELIKERRTVL